MIKYRKRKKHHRWPPINKEKQLSVLIGNESLSHPVLLKQPISGLLEKSFNFEG